MTFSKRKRRNRVKEKKNKERKRRNRVKEKKNKEEEDLKKSNFILFTTSKITYNLIFNAITSMLKLFHHLLVMLKCL